MTAPFASGDRVKIKFEATVTAKHSDGCVSLRGDNQHAYMAPAWAVTLIAPAEPAWYPPRYGDLAQRGDDPDCGTAIYGDDDRWYWMWAQGWIPIQEDDIPGLTDLMVRDGLPYIPGGAS